jgi:subtilisin family serine protease
LVNEVDRDRVIRKLRENDFVVEVGKGFAGMARLILPRNPEDIPRIVRLLRDPRQWPGERVPFVQPHHVVVGHGGNVHGHPGDRPRPSDPLKDPKPDERNAKVVVGVIDTGICHSASSDHSGWFKGRYAQEADDVDKAYSSGDLFALQGGHGTFVAGVVESAAPGVIFDPEVALDPNGLGDEETLCAKIAELGDRVSILNLSLGCFTEDDVASEPLRRTINGLKSDVVVVASAANQGTTRRSWPAALRNVVAVAALAQNGDGSIVPACYSNHGDWVDLCAIGNRTSTYLKGEWQLPGEPAATPFALWAYWAGTSFAAPHVSGRIAQTMSDDGISAPQARDKLLASGPEFHPGYGVFIK